MIRVKRKLLSYTEEDDKEHIKAELTSQINAYFESVGLNYSIIEFNDDTCQKLMIASATYKID